MKSSKEIRQAWIDYFVSKGHMFIPSKSLIPSNDPSLLWINSGVATLKDYFSGKKKPPSKRLTNSQKSIRTNDIENVGITARHHTFFEMLGNFSIGDYFKNEAIDFAHEVVTKIFKLSQDKIYITYFFEDLEVKKKWLSLGYKENQLIAGSRDTNFWDVGSGPCGPNTEIFYDRGIKYHEKGPELIEDDIENDRFIEIWNIVFSQYNNLGNNQYVELKQKNIDTGAGLERIVSILQDGPTNFDTDLFLPIIYEIEKMTIYRYDIENYFKKDPKQNLINKYFKVISDHMRAITNAISDGEMPSNTQRGYIIRRLIRRAYYSGKKLDINKKSFLYKLVPIVVDTLIFNVDINKVSEIIKKEEETFSITIDQGKKILDDELVKARLKKEFDVNLAFKLYETYGFPIEMTNDILLENNIKLDLNKLNKLKKDHSKKSKSIKNINSFDKQINSLEIINSTVSKFIGYDHLELKNAKILYLLNDEKKIHQSNNNDISYLILEQTPFYATSGGQMHDQGYLIQGENRIEILDIFKDKHNNNIHIVKGNIDAFKLIDAYVDKQIRLGLMRNHSATHLTFAALRNIYGDKIEQLGSNNNQDRLTFDFPLDHKPTDIEIKKIEDFVKEIIKKNVKRNYIETTIEEAKNKKAIMTINELEYFDSNKIRIVEFPNVTADLCGGTHIQETKDLENYKIISLESKGVGIYRIRAITSNKTINEYLNKEIDKNLSIFNQIYKKYQDLYNNKNIPFKIKKYNFDNIENLENKLTQIKQAISIISLENKNISKLPNKYNEKIIFNNLKFNDIDILFANNIDKNNLKDEAIKMREKYPNYLIIAISKYIENKSTIIISSKTINVKEFIDKNLNNLNLKGGGNSFIWQGVSDNNIKKEDLIK